MEDEDLLYEVFINAIENSYNENPNGKWFIFAGWKK